MKKYYESKQLVKREIVDGRAIDTYVAFKDGIIYLKKYVNCVFDSETCIADLNKDDVVN